MEQFDQIDVPAQCIGCPGLVLLQQRLAKVATEVAELTEAVLEGEISSRVFEGLIFEDGYDPDDAKQLVANQAHVIADEIVGIIGAYEQQREQLSDLGRATVAGCARGVLQLRGDDAGTNILAAVCRSSEAHELSPAQGILPAAISAIEG